MSRWLAALTLVFLVALGADANAQVFKPRGKSGPKKATPAAPAAAATSKKQTTRSPTKDTAPRRVTTTKPAKTSRVATSKGRPNDLTPEPGAKGKKDKDAVVVDDDDDDDAPVRKPAKPAKAAKPAKDDDVIIRDD